MTTATLRLATPTPFERSLQRLAAALSRHVDHRIAARAERRDLALDMLREQQARKQDPRALDLALAHMGLPLR
ncbi:putative sensor protein [Microbacterium sp. HM58-2]|nr:putative sensor protein [Microbacterium sp. HM58-2]